MATSRSQVGGPLKRATLAVLLLLIAGITQSNARSADFYHIVTVRYDSGVVNYFLGGPYNGKSWCDKLAQTVWDNVVATCGKCRREFQSCVESSVLPEPYKRTFRSEPIANPYVAAMPKGRIIFAGVDKETAVRACQRAAAEFRANGYLQAVCIFQ